MRTSLSTSGLRWTGGKMGRSDRRDPGSPRLAYAWPAGGWWLLIAVAAGWFVLAVSPAEAVVDAAFSGPDHWRWLGSVGGGGDDSIALAQSIFGDIAVGDDSGVSWWRDDVRERAVLPGVRDLAFDSQGLLWIATSQGLFSWNRSGRPARKRLPGGEAGNEIARIAVSESTLLLATAAGAVWSSQGRIFQSLRASAVASQISHVALRPARFDRRDRENRPSPTAASGSGDDLGRRSGYAGITQAWLFGAGRLSVIRGIESASGMRVTGREAVAVPRARSGSDDGPVVVDLVIDPRGQRVYLVFEESIAWRLLDANASVSASSTSRWHIERPSLPPGALIRALGWASGRVWLATDHGLLSGESVAGPFRRAASPVGTTSCVEIQPREFEQALALCRRGVFALSIGSSRPAADVETANGSSEAPVSPVPSVSPARLLPDPPLAEIRRRALMRSGLTVGRANKMWDRLRRRAYWPDLALSFDVDFDYDQADDDDQSFISGDTRRLFDRSRDEGRRYRAAIEFDWRLGGLVYPLETVNLSRELRQIVSLRDDVADEVNQLYFERQAIRQSLASSATTDSNEVARLTWRARELDAGLDAWTGGWISHWRALSPTSRFAKRDPEHRAARSVRDQTITPEPNTTPIKGR